MKVIYEKPLIFTVKFQKSFQILFELVNEKAQFRKKCLYFVIDAPKFLILVLGFSIAKTDLFLKLYYNKI